MPRDRPPAPPFPRDDIDPKTTIGSAQNQQPFVEYFARAPPESGDNNGYIYWLGTEAKSKKFENPHDGGRLRVRVHAPVVRVAARASACRRGLCGGCGRASWLVFG